MFPFAVNQWDWVGGGRGVEEGGRKRGGGRKGEC